MGANRKISATHSRSAAKWSFPEEWELQQVNSLFTLPESGNSQESGNGQSDGNRPELAYSSGDREEVRPRRPPPRF
jgi:hypothetical protein